MQAADFKTFLADDKTVLKTTQADSGQAMSSIATPQQGAWSTGDALSSDRTPLDAANIDSVYAFANLMVANEEIMRTAIAHR